MTISISQVRERVSLAAHCSDIQQVGDSIIRFVRKMRDVPFAVYYLDVARLPESEEELTKYQDQVIGGYYFQGRKSLQWNNYLYFVASESRLASSEARQAKEMIERDRSYARKFVISEKELESVLRPPDIAPADATLRPGVLSVWTERLVEAGLDRAILSDEDIPKRLKRIEDSSTVSAPGPKAPRRTSGVKSAPFIRSFHLKKFLDFPLQRKFEFGTVNLISGPNGTGKTLLLEAIELFYCGQNKRNPGTPAPYELIAVLADGRTERATDNRNAREFRDRNLSWYGQSEVKTNYLYLSFAQFNFMDTDAAVSLAADKKSPARIEEDLSKLLVGADASKTWRDIERVYEAVAERLREIRPLEDQIKGELSTLEKRLEEASNVKQESDSIRTRLEEMLRRIGWPSPQGDKDTFTTSLVGTLSELVSLAQQAATLDWTLPPVSIDGLTRYCTETKSTIEKAEPDIARLELLRKNQRPLADASTRDREALDLVKQAKRLIEVDVPKRVAERNKQHSIVATHSGRLAGLDADALGVLSTADLDINVATCHEAAVSKRSAGEASLARARSEYANFSKLRDQSLNLAQELRQVAARILQTSSKPDECPLCHTQFAPGELARHIKVGVDEHLEALGQTLLTKLQEREGEVREATAAEVSADWLREFCERANLPVDISVQSALAKVEDAKRTLAEGRRRLEALNRDVLTLESQGLSLARLEEISLQLRALGYPLAEFSCETVERLLSTIDQDLANSSRTLETERTQEKEIQHTLSATLGSVESEVQDQKGALSQLKERLAATASLRAKIGEFSASFPWSGGRPLSELAIEAESVRKVAAEMQAALGREEQAQAIYTESIERKRHLQKQLAQLQPRIKRFTDAHSALENLRSEHSLTSAMASTLKQNRARIEMIFSYIHSPAEFSGLGSGLAMLVRKTDGSEVTLSQISSGQRAAFALSIFLAQNDQLTVAPPVVLIDDPIAHVDDLNSLSFLDYLREVALRDKRQIFFATASDKLATLFERKFDFLGQEGFRRFDLVRDAHVATLSG